MNVFLCLQALLQILRFEYYLRRGDFALLYQAVRDCPRSDESSSREWIEPICRAIDIACVCYPKLVLCLQRSAATVCLLRRYGLPALLVIGIQEVPFKAHAWVEVNGRVVNDKPYTREMYTALDCC
jgi:prolyl oligopeptidase